jgi:hypothetical protein
MLLLLIPFTSLSQNLHLQVELKQAAGMEIFLANYYLGNIYAKDTLLLDNEGKGVFEADTLLPQGLYKIFADENRHFDFLLGADQQFILKNETFQSETMQIEGSEETKAFAEYTGYLKGTSATKCCDTKKDGNCHCTGKRNTYPGIGRAYHRIT